MTERIRTRSYLVPTSVATHQNLFNVSSWTLSGSRHNFERGHALVPNKPRARLEEDFCEEKRIIVPYGWIGLPSARCSGRLALRKRRGRVFRIAARNLSKQLLSQTSIHSQTRQRLSRENSGPHSGLCAHFLLS